MSDWIDSPQRAIENASGKVAMARALDLSRIELDTEDLAKVVSSVKSDLESAVIEAAIRFRRAESAAWVESEVGTEESAAQAKAERPRAYGAFVNAVDALLTARGGMKHLQRMFEVTSHAAEFDMPDAPDTVTGVAIKRKNEQESK